MLTFYLDCSWYRVDCFSVCAFEVALSCLDTVLFSTIQQVGYFLLFSSRWCFSASFCFLFPALFALLDCGGAVSLQLRKIPCIHWNGGCPLCDELTLAMGYRHCGGGMWRVLENRFCELPELPPFSAVFLALLGSARACGEEASLGSHGSVHSFSYGCCPHCYLKIPSHLHLILLWWGQRRRERDVFSGRETASAPLKLQAIV